jgi:O-antigen biosynthesis protein
MSVVDRPTVSVVIPCYNQASFAFEAALSAKYAYDGPLDVIIINDGSTEAAAPRKLLAIREALGDERCEISIVHQENKGLPATRNAGVDRAVGDFIQFLDADDLLVAEKIGDQIKHLRLATRVDVSLTDCITASERLDEFERHKNLIAGYGHRLEDFALHWERGFSIPIHCALFRRGVFDRVRFNEAVKAKEDWVFWTQLVMEGGRLSYLGTNGAVYRIHAGSMCRATRSIGRQWIRAAAEIDRFVGDICPSFMDCAVDWYEGNYRTALDQEPFVDDAAPPNRHAKTSSSGGVPSPGCVGAERRLRGQRLSARAPRISVVVPVYNHLSYLNECFNSLALQQIDEMEVIVVDDASEDPGVAQFLDDLQRSDSIFRVLTNTENLGIVQSQTRAIGHATGDYIVFVDCDDSLPPRALDRAFRYIDAQGGCDYFFSDRFDVDENGDVLRLARYGGYDDERFTGAFRADILNGMVASHLKIVRRDAFHRVGGFDPTFSGVQDWELALKMAEAGKFLYLDQPLYRHRIHEQSVTTRDFRAQFHLGNLVRRKYAPRLTGLDERARLASSVRTLFYGDEEIGVLEVAEAWRRGPVTLDATRPLSHKNLWLFREFNSYLDEILWSSSEVYASLLGFLWSPAILRRV